MYTPTILVITLTSMLAAAFPTSESAPSYNPATILFTLRELHGLSITLPANNTCIDLSSILGDYDRKIRSLMVVKGTKCAFYTELSCASIGDKLELGSEVGDVIRESLEPSWDLKIRSVYCADL
ncbi:hypothetical protein IQ07DRAFT_117318 [Pyrenochaeta sp. DS3sAY3a]|nr:hypothetical protein IQ07DRAFT_117318 [Pyrenochaeta sp. DS3sAY3a]